VLDGVAYVVVRRSAFDRLCAAVGVQAADAEPLPAGDLSGLAVDDQTLARRIAVRRKAVGMTQAELARLADVRTETISRIERGHTTPDFATIRKLVRAMESAGRLSAGRNQP
jgi:DNA-binding XRE family transcriptional regulator